MTQYFHVYSKGLLDSQLYHDDEDFVCGMNDIPLALLSVPNLAVIVFCLMNNHFHFVFYGEQSDCEKFLFEFRRRTARRLHEKYGDVDSVAKMEPTIHPISSKERLRETLIYVLCNPVKPGICSPQNYRWSSANLYFRGDMKFLNLHKIKDLGQRPIRENFHTRRILPEEYLVEMPTWMIHPISYVDVETAQKWIGSLKNFLYMISKNDEAEVEARQCAEQDVIAGDDKVRSLIGQICINEYNEKSFETLDYNRKLQVAVKLYKRHHIKLEQIARLTRLDYETLQMFK